MTQLDVNFPISLLHTINKHQPINSAILNTTMPVLLKFEDKWLDL